ncbi:MULTISPECIES: hypothetical protein [unclassified Mesorhizobium]|nr:MULTISPECIES: hypothetical protein [unclassified Mesorhizobium]
MSALEWTAAAMLAGMVYILCFSDLIVGLLARGIVAELVRLWL